MMMDFTSAFDASQSNGGKSPPKLTGLAGFDEAQPAPQFKAVPAGIYSARVVRGEVCQTKAGADAYRLRFEITEGEQTGQTLIRTWTFSDAAMQYTKRDLAPFGLNTAAQLLSPFPGLKEFHVRLQVALQRGNDGREFNDVKRIDILRVVDSPASAFMIPGTTEGGRK